jgi:tetratricopeptide (TPR) repeat protein
MLNSSPKLIPNSSHLAEESVSELGELGLVTRSEKASVTELRAIFSLYVQRKQWEELGELCKQLIEQAETLELSDHTVSLIYKQLGAAYQSLGRKDCAKSAYRQALLLYPDYAEVYANLGTLQVSQGNVQQAIACYQRAVQIDSQCVAVYRNLARLWERVGDEGRALACWSRALELEPLGMSVAQQVELGDRWLKLDRWQESEQCYRRAINFECQVGALWAKLGEVLTAQKRWGEAVLCYERAIALQDRRDRSVNCYWGLARLLATLEQWSKAAKVYQAAVRIDPENSELWHQWGDVLSKLERWELAAAAYRRAISIEPDRSWSYNNLGDALMRRSEWAAAADAYRQMTLRQPDFVWAFYNLGDATAHCGQWDEAVLAYQRAMQLQSNLPEIALKLAQAYQARIRFDFEAAQHWYAQAGQVMPDIDDELAVEMGGLPTPITSEPDIQVEPVFCTASTQEEELVERDAAEAEFQAGKVHLEAGRQDKAKFAFEQAIALNPNHAWAHHHLGDILKAEGDREAAIAAYDQAIVVSDSPSFWSYYNRGQLLAQQGKAEAAISSYQASIAINPNYSWTHKHLGDLWAVQGDIDAASRCYRQAVRCHPELH